MAARSKSPSKKSSDSSANLGFEAKLWLSADKLRNNMDAAVTERSDKRRQQSEPYKHVSNPTTRRLAIMNLALRGIEADFGPENADTFRRDLHPDLRADTATRVSANPQPRSHLAGLMRSERQLLANPPFNEKPVNTGEIWELYRHRNSATIIEPRCPHL